jgi:hypothetical protein
MVYQIESGSILLKIDRSLILDITPGDEIEVPGLSDKKYNWKHQDSQFLESNPDAEIFLMFNNAEAEKLRPVEIVIKS